MLNVFFCVYIGSLCIEQYKENTNVVRNNDKKTTSIHQFLFNSCCFTSKFIHNKRVGEWDVYIQYNRLHTYWRCFTLILYYTFLLSYHLLKQVILVVVPSRGKSYPPLWPTPLLSLSTLSKRTHGLIRAILVDRW